MEHVIEDEDDTPYDRCPACGIFIAVVVSVVAWALIWWGASAAFWLWTNAAGVANG